MHRASWSLPLLMLFISKETRLYIMCLIEICCTVHTWLNGMHYETVYPHCVYESTTRLVAQL